jgi:large subunit ribosomal protein L1
LYNPKQRYGVGEAIEIVKKITFTKFDASMDVGIHLDMGSQKTDQVIRGTIILPHGTGKVKRVLVLCDADKTSEAKKAGADYVGADDYIKKIEEGWCDFDVVVTVPALMGRVGRLGKILGPRGMMPNPKTGTITMDIAKAVKEIKMGKVEYRADKSGIIHNSIGRVSFDNVKLEENIRALSAAVEAAVRVLKNCYIKSISLSSTMSKGVFINTTDLK